MSENNAGGPSLKRRWLTIIGATLLLLATFYGMLVLRAHPAPDHPFFARFAYRPLVIAHRGGAGLFPEETLFAFEQSVAMGVDVLEMDLHSSADGVLVLMHDAALERTTDGIGHLHDMSLADLQALDAGYRWSADGGQSFPFRGQGIRVATFEEVLSRFPDIALIVEIKQEEPSLVEPFCTMLRDYDATERVLVASFSPEVMDAFQQECPEVARGAGAAEVKRFFALNMLFLGTLFSPSSHVFQVPEYSEDGLHVLTRRFVATAQRRNIEVQAWTINETSAMQRMLDLGVDGIITDYPDRALALLGRATRPDTP